MKMNKTSIIGASYPAELAKLPCFAEISWKNDAADSVQFCHPDRSGQYYRIWIAEDDPDMREFYDADKFSINKIDFEEGEDYDELYSTESPTDLMQWIRKLRAMPSPKVAPSGDPQPKWMRRP
jgi:hypothetical protein